MQNTHMTSVSNCLHRCICSARLPPHVPKKPVSSTRTQPPSKFYHSSISPGGHVQRSRPVFLPLHLYCQALSRSPKSCPQLSLKFFHSSSFPQSLNLPNRFSATSLPSSTQPLGTAARIILQKLLSNTSY